jgi:hypothetical protein
MWHHTTPHHTTPRKHKLNTRRKKKKKINTKQISESLYPRVFEDTKQIKKAPQQRRLLPSVLLPLKLEKKLCA